MATLQPNSNNDWLIDPFNVSKDLKNISHLPVPVAESLLEVAANPELRLMFKRMTAVQFWPSLASTHPVIARYALNTLLPFASAWTCETSFSAMATLKSKARNRLHLEYDLRLALCSNTLPRIDRILMKVQAQPSH